MEHQQEGKSLEPITSSRADFLAKDSRLEESLERLLEGAASREQCLIALIDQQRAYDLYMGQVLKRLGRLRD